MPFSASAAAVREKRESSNRVFCRRSGSAGNTIATRYGEMRPLVLRIDQTLQVVAVTARVLRPLAVGEAAEKGDAIGFGPKAHHAGFREGCILDREQGLAVE